MQGCEWVFVSTQSWCRHAALHAIASGRRVAVDIQAPTGIDDYHRDLLDRAEVVILSTERLGELLLDHDPISREQLEQALAEQRRRGGCHRGRSRPAWCSPLESSRRQAGRGGDSGEP